MSLSITRKFLPNELPDLSGKAKDVYERFYLYNQNSIVIRIQKINDRYELERRANESELVRAGDNIEITKAEFDQLKSFAKESIQRDSYNIQESPKIVLRIYHGDYEGLARIEVNFESETDASSFIPLNWFGKEITGTPLAQDGYLLKLSKEEFTKLLSSKIVT
jgi:CYTH domain-containing protein